MRGLSSGPRSNHNQTHLHWFWHDQAAFSCLFPGTCAIASELLVFGGCKPWKQVWSWTMLHVRSKHIYQELVVKCLSGVGCLVEKRRFSQPLQTVRMDRTPPVLPVVPSVRLFLFCFVLYERRMGSNPWSCPCSSSSLNMVGIETYFAIQQPMFCRVFCCWEGGVSAVVLNG